MGAAIGADRIFIKGWGAVVDFAEGRALSPQVCARLVETFGDGLLFKSGKRFSISIDTGKDSGGRVSDPNEGGERSARDAQSLDSVFRDLTRVDERLDRGSEWRDASAPADEDRTQSA